MDIVGEYAFRANTGELEAAARRAGAQSADDKKLFEACQDFEAIFIKQMLDVMRKTVHKTGLLDGGAAEEIFEDMLYDEYAAEMARTARFGLAETMYGQLTQSQRDALLGPTGVYTG